MNINQSFFVGYRKDYLDSPREDSYGYYSDHHLSIIEPPVSSDWEDNFVAAKQGDDPVVVAIEVYGDLLDSDDMADLQEWLEYSGYELGPAVEEHIEDVLQTRSNELNGVYEDGEVGIATAEEDIAIMLDGEVSATEGPFSAVKDAVANAAVKKAVKSAVKEGSIDEAFVQDEAKINAAFGKSKAVKETTLSPAHVALYLINQVVNEGQSVLKCWAAFRLAAGASTIVDIGALISKNSSDISILKGLAGEKSSAHAEERNYYSGKKEQQVLKSIQVSWTSIIANAVNATKKKSTGGAVLVGYTRDSVLADEWANSTAATAFAATSSMSPARLNAIWKSLMTDSAARSEMLEKLLPAQIRVARAMLKSYFNLLPEPFTNWMWELVLKQSKDLLSAAVEYMLSKQARRVAFETIFDTYGDAGLDLSAGIFPVAGQKGKVDNVAQVVLIYSVYALDPKKLSALRGSSGWLGVSEMNTKFNDISADLKQDKIEKHKRGPVKTTSQTRASDIRKYWKALNPEGYKLVEGKGDAEVIAEFTRKVRGVK